MVGHAAHAASLGLLGVSRRRKTCQGGGLYEAKAYGFESPSLHPMP